MRHFIKGTILTALLSYPLLFFVHKYLIPWSGDTDFASYHDMVAHPFAFGIVPAPFAMRQVTTALARILLDLDIVHRNDIWFDHFTTFRRKTFSKDIFFVMLLINEIGLVTTGGLLYWAIVRGDDRPRLISVYGVAGIAGLVLCGTSIFYVIAPLTDGVSWALVIGCWILYRQDGRIGWLLPPLILLSVFQRELLALIFLIIALTEAAAERGRLTAPRRRRIAATILTCLAAMALYHTLRSTVLPVMEVHPHQLRPGTWITYFFGHLRDFMSYQVIRGSLFKLNFVVVWLLLVGLSLRRRDLGPQAWSIAALGLCAVSGYLIGLGTRAGPGADRYVGLLAPLFVLQAVELWRRLDGDAAPARG